MTTQDKLADALRIAMEWNWLDDDARPSRVAEVCDEALAEHAASLAATPAPAADHVLVPRVSGVGRDAEYAKALIVYFDRPVTNDEMRAFHDAIRGLQKNNSGHVRAMVEQPAPAPVQPAIKAAAEVLGDPRNSVKLDYAQPPAPGEAELDRVAKAIADVIGHGMREKCIDHARAAIATLRQPVPESVRAVLAELERATRKFPTWPTDPLHAVAVVGEEAGELTKAVLQAVYEPHKSTPEDVATEAIQTAAMALRFIDSLPRYVYARGEQHSQQEARGNGE